MTPAGEDIESAEFFPPRYWWTVRIVPLCLVILLGLVGLRIWWGHDIAARFEARVKGIRLASAAMQQMELPDDQNAAFYLQQAAEAVNLQAPPACYSFPMLTIENYLPMSPEWRQLTQAAIAGNARSLALARKASQFRHANWGNALDAPDRYFYQTPTPLWVQLRTLADLLSDSALEAHLSGDNTEALARLADLWALAETLDQQPDYETHLTAGGMLISAANRINMIGPGLEHPTPEDRQKVQDLIAHLLARSSRSALDRAWQSELVQSLEMAEHLTRNCVVLRPLFQRDMIYMLDYMDKQFAPATQPSYQTAKSMAAPRAVAGGIAVAITASMTMARRIDVAVEWEFFVRLQCALSAVSLASQLYRMDHDGQWPANLQALTPDYLPAVPVDLMSARGDPLKYVLFNNGHRPVVYSVGIDGIDNTARGNVTLPAVPQYTQYPPAPDDWRDLSRFDPPPTTAPQKQ